MNILMIAPEPFFEPRGTPFSEYFRIKALCDLGHRVDLVTYPIGEDKKIEGLRIFRSLRPPFLRSIRTGPSPAKIILDFFLFFKGLWRLIRGKYDVIHTHEEANIMGVIYNKLSGIPHLYDMHSSLVQQMSNFRFTSSRFIVGVFKWMEKRSLLNAKSVIVICKALQEYAAGITGPEKITLIENFIDESPEILDPEIRDTFKKQINCPGRKIIMYTGTLEAYQGIPLLVESLHHLDESYCLVLIGGTSKQVEALRSSIDKNPPPAEVFLLGRRKAEEIPYFLGIADVLVSPRSLGTNIPLKIYAYLKSGIPVVATDLYTHTQSLTAEIAILVKPEPVALAEGINAAAGPRGKIIAGNAVKFCKQNYSYSRYRDLIAAALERAVGVDSDSPSRK